MRTTRRLLTVMAVVALTAAMMPLATAAPDGGDLRTVGLETEHRTEPLAVDTPQPRLAWRLDTEVRGVLQTSYEVLVATSPDRLEPGEADVWESGVVEARRAATVYDGPELETGQRYHWTVRVHDTHGRTSAWAEPSWWEVGVIDRDDWDAHWIGADVDAAPGINNTAQNYPAALHEAQASLGQSFEVDAPFTSVAGRLPTWNADDSAATLTLREDGPDGAAIASRRLDPMVDNAWEAIEVDEPLPAGRYYLELSDPDGTAGWWSHDGEVIAGGEAFEDGEVVAGSRTLRVEVEPPTPPALRTDFTVDGEVASARLHASALGLYELHLNGQRVGDAELAPGWTDYDERVQYQTYDVTELVAAGDNAIGALLADGWYAGHVAIAGRNVWGTQPWLFAQLEITTTDGDSTTVVTDGSWTATEEGPIRAADILMGEEVDARLAIDGFAEPGFDDDWGPVVVRDDSAEVTDRLVAQPSELDRVTTEIEPVEITELDDDRHLVDLGQNMVGWVRLAIESGDAGDTVTLRHAEVLDPDTGELYTDSLRSAEATDRYTLAGDGTEVYEPRFTFHGFRYVEVEGYPGELTADHVTGRVIHTDAELTSSLDTSNEMVNQLQRNIVWGQLGNFLSIPTDTPARDERMGWTGDINLFAGTAAFNQDVRAFLEKWMDDLRDGQREDGALPDVAPYVPIVGFGTNGWGDAGVTVPWVLWQRYGDTRVIEDNYQLMVDWIGYLEANSDELVRPPHGYGDHVNLDDEPTPTDLIGTAFFAHSTRLLSEMAAATGRGDDAERYEQLFHDIRAAFVGRFVDDDGRVEGDTQTGYALALDMDLVPTDLRDAAAGHLVDLIDEQDGHLTTGFLGTERLLPALTDTGHDDVAYQLLTNESYPSWGYMIAQGATTVWEHWDAYHHDRGFQDPDMNSFNHFPFGSVGDWLFRQAAGIDVAEAGFDVIDVHPRPDDALDHVAATYDSVHGRIATRWERDGDALRLDVTVPPNASARVTLPTTTPWAVTEGGQPADLAEAAAYEERVGDDVVFTVGSGRYAFVAGCPDPDDRATVVLADTDSGVANRDVTAGCTLADLIHDGHAWPTHGAFVRHVTEVTADLRADGVIDVRERAALLQAAARSRGGGSGPAG